MYQCYAQTESYGLMIKAGGPVKTIDKALQKARALRARQVEVRDHALPRNRSLVAVFREGVQLCN